MDLSLVCGVAFLTVLTLLSLLALCIRALTALFPPPPAPAPVTTRPSGRPDPATIAAIHSAVHRHSPGSRVIDIRPDQPN